MKKIIFLLFIFYSLLFSALLHPENDANEKTIHILFEWDQIPNANYYNLQVSTQQSFNTILIDIDNITTVYIETNNLDWNDTYYWRVRGIDENGNNGSWNTSFFDIDEQRLTNLSVEPFEDDLVVDGVMVYSQFLPYFIVGAVDKNGNEIWNTDTAYMNHINEFGQMYGIIGNGNYSRGYKYNFHHDFLWQSPNDYDIDSHEVKQIPNGNYMAFQRVFESGPIPQGDWSFYFQGQGYQVDGITNEFPWLGLKIVEFNKDTNEEVWSWDPFEHFSMDDHDIYEGTWWNAAFDGFYDWMHSNAFHFDENESVIYASHRHLSRLTKIAYPSGDVIWNMGLPGEYNTGENNICTDLLFSYQHHIQLMDNGDLLFFDNGNLSDMLLDDPNPITRIRRIKVLDDSYCETVWQYDLPQNLHGLGMGSVQELYNGNYFIYTFGSGLNDGECSILEISPDGEVMWKATSQNQNAAWYRSYKIPSIYPDAFSVIADNYILSSEDNEYILVDQNNIKFTVYNKSGYTQKFKYIFSDLLDGGPQMFLDEESELTLSPDESIELIFTVVNSEITSTSIGLNVWPTYHDYALKELLFTVKKNNILIGDLNNDGDINVVDIIQLVNLVLTNEYASSGDINQDQLMNVLDIISLVNLILGN